MRIVFVPRPPEAIRHAAEALVPVGHSLSFVSEDAPEYSEALAQADVLIGVPRNRLDERFFATAESLQLIQLLRRGIDKVDLNEMRSHEVRLATIGDLTASSVAEHTLAMILSLGRSLPSQWAMVNEHRWAHAKPWQLPHGLVDTVPFQQCTGIRGLKLGLWGLGNIGSQVATLAAALGMDVQATTRASPGQQVHGVPIVSVEELLATSDVLSLHLTLSAETRGILSAERLACMKVGATLINTARGELVDEDALLEALDSGRLAGAGLDTLQKEPPAPDHPLLGRPDVILTPHSGWLSRASWQTVLECGFENIDRFAQDKPLAYEEQP